MRPKKLKDKDKGKTTTTITHDLGSNSGDETKITAMGLKGKDISSTISSSCLNSTQDDETRIGIFHVIVISMHTKIDTLSDSRSK